MRNSEQALQGKYRRWKHVASVAHGWFWNISKLENESTRAQPNAHNFTMQTRGMQGEKT